MNNIYYLWNRIAEIDPSVKVETRTPFPILFVLGHLKTGKMKEIQLTQGYVTQVDDSDYEWLNQWKWYINNTGWNNYAMRTEWIKGVFKKIMMHRIIMKTSSNMEVDHIDHNGLNNQRLNLRNCTHSQNGKNRSSYSKSGFLGVKQDGKWASASIRINGKQIYLGCFRLKTEAAFAYDIAAMQYHKEFANLNFHYAKWFRDYLYSRDKIKEQLKLNDEWDNLKDFNQPLDKPIEL